MSIRLENVSYRYGKGTSTETVALKQVHLEIHRDEFVAVIGHTGSGKSTLIQQFNGLEKPDEGSVSFDGMDIWQKGYDRRFLRCRVGLVFQYPEYQLFEETVLKDVCFGPLNKQLGQEQGEQKAKEALTLVGIGEDVYDVSPFELSGGQKRRVAIAGILAMEPEYLIMDEPTAGLDPKGRNQILKLVSRLHKEKGMGIILVSHSMEDVAKYASRIIVMNQGMVAMDDTPAGVFKKYKELEAMGLAAPQICYLMNELKRKGFPVDEDVIDLEKAKQSILACVKH